MFFFSIFKTWKYAWVLFLMKFGTETITNHRVGDNLAIGTTQEDQPMKFGNFLCHPLSGDTVEIE